MQNWHSVPSWLSCTLLGARSTDPMSVRMQTADRSIRYLVVLPDQPVPTSDTTALMQPPSTEHSDAYSCSTWPRRARPYSRPYAQRTLTRISEKHRLRGKLLCPGSSQAPPSSLPQSVPTLEGPPRIPPAHRADRSRPAFLAANPVAKIVLSRCVRVGLQSDT